MIRYLVCLVVLLLPLKVEAQTASDLSAGEINYGQSGDEESSSINLSARQQLLPLSYLRHIDPYGFHSYDSAQTETREEYPDPKRVLYRSMILPGWGQVTNRQVWKVPIIYALFAGIGYWNYELTREYHGFRAAYYNATSEEADERFGPTPDFVPPDMSSQQVRQIRDELRNRRDLTYVYLFLAYGLNILDAYVFAHMRSFDVSDDLSARPTIGPELNEYGSPGIRVRVSLLRH